MTKIAVVFLSLFAISIALYPGKLYREYWGNKLMSINLINMTLLMCKDAKLKLRQADHVQEGYKNSFAYELGLLASGINDRFKHMLMIYRFYSNPLNFKPNKHDIDMVMRGYHAMQSDYNEIRMEIDLFQEVVDNKVKKTGKEDKELEEYAAKHPGVDLEKLKEARDAGMLPPGSLAGMAARGRRSMGLGNQTKIDQTSQNKTDWKKKNDLEEAEYKKQLRYIMWAEKWKGYNPEIEGVHIEQDIAKAGLQNASEFSLKEFEGIFK